MFGKFIENKRPGLCHTVRTPTAVSSVSLKLHWNKIASFEVLNGLRGKAWSVIFPSWSCVYFLPQKKYIQFVTTAQKCP